MAKHERHLQAGQQGFTIGSLVMVLVLIALGFLAYRFVARANSENKEQAGKLGNALLGEEQAGDNQDYSSGNRSSADQTQLWENPIRSLNVKPEPATVTFTAIIPGTYQGTCAVELRPEGGGERLRFVEPLRGTKTCEIYVPTGKLSDSKNWRYEFGYYSSDGRTYGKYPEGTLRL